MSVPPLNYLKLGEILERQQRRPQTSSHRNRSRLVQSDLTDSATGSEFPPGHLASVLAAPQPVQRTPKPQSGVRSVSSVASTGPSPAPATAAAAAAAAADNVPKLAAPLQRKHKHVYEEAMATVKEWQGTAAEVASSCASTLVWAQVSIAHAEQLGREVQANTQQGACRAAQLVRGTAALQLLRRLSALLGDRFSPTLSWIITGILSVLYRTSSPPRTREVHALSKDVVRTATANRPDLGGGKEPLLQEWSGRGVAPPIATGVEVDQMPPTYMELYDEMLIKCVALQDMNRRQRTSLRTGANALSRALRRDDVRISGMCFRAWRGETKRATRQRRALTAAFERADRRRVLAVCTLLWRVAVKATHLRVHADKRIKLAKQDADRAEKLSQQLERRRCASEAECTTVRKMLEDARLKYEEEIRGLKCDIASGIAREDAAHKAHADTTAALVAQRGLFRSVLDGARGTPDVVQGPRRGSTPPAALVRCAERLAAEMKEPAARKRSTDSSPPAGVPTARGEASQLLCVWIQHELAQESGAQGLMPRNAQLVDVVRIKHGEPLIALARRLLPHQFPAVDAAPSEALAAVSVGAPDVGLSDSKDEDGQGHVPFQRANLLCDVVRTLLTRVPGAGTPPLSTSTLGQKLAQNIKHEHIFAVGGEVTVQLLHALAGVFVVHRAWQHLAQPVPSGLDVEGVSVVSHHPLFGRHGSMRRQQRRRESSTFSLDSQHVQSIEITEEVSPGPSPLKLQVGPPAPPQFALTQFSKTVRGAVVAANAKKKLGQSPSGGHRKSLFASDTALTASQPTLTSGSSFRKSHVAPLSTNTLTAAQPVLSPPRGSTMATPRAPKSPHPPAVRATAQAAAVVSRLTTGGAGARMRRGSHRMPSVVPGALAVTSANQSPRRKSVAPAVIRAKFICAEFTVVLASAVAAVSAALANAPVNRTRDAGAPRRSDCDKDYTAEDVAGMRLWQAIGSVVVAWCVKDRQGSGLRSSVGRKQSAVVSRFQTAIVPAIGKLLGGLKNRSATERFAADSEVSSHKSHATPPTPPTPPTPDIQFEFTVAKSPASDG
eukprot:TRINITY_DN5996_c0_g1_i2.p1 TRINITY_DN5996_c0_g1~~TRINITY_DN5996_c0_g1_i2.p1  ORF type:complete len:1062 (+),score=107.77 TRINITY_DN5996_c0_g1_i2:68-3253(+)